MRYSCGHVSTKKNVRGLKDAAASTPPLRSSRYIRYRDNIGDNQYGESYNIGNKQYSSKNLSYCPIHRFLESVTLLTHSHTHLAPQPSCMQMTLLNFVLLPLPPPSRVCAVPLYRVCDSPFLHPPAPSLPAACFCSSSEAPLSRIPFSVILVIRSPCDSS